ncbi:MAG TPA: hypothetical protein VN634_14135 [Candidatus Limnocylindrales bacterium]|nr:hypothetical protein [Candidatus Limnocylindrales bacterium]
MSTANRGLSRSLVLLVAVLAANALQPSGAWAAAQSAAQQECANNLLKQAAKIGKTQTKANAACIKAAQSSDEEKLGLFTQTRTADACLTNDPKAKLAKAKDKAADILADCSAAPDFGSTLGVSAGAGDAGAHATIRDIFGLNVDELWRLLPYDDEAASECQSALVGAGGKLYNAIWKEGLNAIKASLAGDDVPQATSAAELTSALAAQLTGNEKIVKAIGTFGGKLTASCNVTTQPLLELARGRCGATTALALGGCALLAIRCEACRALNGASGTTVDCDVFDNSSADNSCVGLANAHIITNAAELLTGPLADGQPGDIMMENAEARFIIQKGGVRDMYSVGGFGGNIIDAELVSNPGVDNFLEMQPAINIETVINATSVEIVNDGSNGGPAVVRACGPDDLLDFVNPSTIIADAGLDFPPSADDVDQDVEGCTDYTLEAGATYLRLDTTIFNNEPVQTGFFVGDYVNAAGELEQWASSTDAGLGVRLTADAGVLDFIGYGEAQGVDYGIVTMPPTSDADPTGYFSTSGVTYLLHSQSVLGPIVGGEPPNFKVLSGGSKTFTRYFGVGNGSGANAVSLENLVKGRLSGTVAGCVDVNGVPAPGARVSAGPVQSGVIKAVTSTWVTDASGCYSGTMPVGTYGMAAWREGTPYEGGTATPTVHMITTDPETPVTQDFNLPQTGAISVTATDENGDPVPARVSVIGFDPSPDLILSDSTGLHRDQSDPLPYGFARMIYTDAAGVVQFDMEPGSYRVYVTRGAEYSEYDAAVTVTAGATAPVVAQIARVIDTTGFVSSDHHVHAIASADSRVSNDDRVRQFAGEGVDNVIMTDHHAHTDLTSHIADLGYTGLLTSTIGEEITTWDTGHYNAYPFTIDPTKPSGGSTDWGGAAPAGEDFPSAGSYILEPAAIENLALTQPTATPDTVVQINHIGSHYSPMKIDTGTVPPTTGMTAADRLNFRMNPAGGNLYHQFKALELWNGYNRKHQGEFLNERIGIWFNQLNQGLITTMITDTDTHAFTNLETAGGRTWSAVSTEDLLTLDTAEVAQAVKDGRCTGGQGIYVQTQLIDAVDGSNTADLTLGGSTLLTPTNPAIGLDLDIMVQAPLWADFDTIRIYSNAATSSVVGKPYQYTATPTMTLVAGTDFTITTNNVFPLVPGGQRKEAHVVVPFTNLTADAWYVVVVKGTDGVSRPMFPVFPADLSAAGNTTLAQLVDGNLGQSGVEALGVTNALYADVDGNPGFDAPLAP